jgi:hypothetical protein
MDDTSVTKIRKRNFASGFVWVIDSVYDVNERVLAQCLKNNNISSKLTYDSDVARRIINPHRLKFYTTRKHNVAEKIPFCLRERREKHLLFCVP